ncbi:MAG: phage holin family protein [Planctomycetes bacterium]|nr:phage holin family protein [Planctomycetota bacterium]
MPDNLQTELPPGTETPPSMANLVSGIINDAQQLVRQEVALARREVLEELDKAKTAALSFAIGMVVAVLGGLMFCFCLVYLLAWATGMMNMVWVWFLVVGALFVLAGGILFFVAKSKITSINLVPPQTAATMKENVQWIKNQTP